MKPNVVVTIVTHSFINYAKVLRQSILKHSPDTEFLALVTDASPGATKEDWAISLTDLRGIVAQSSGIIEKYQTDPDSDKLRWALKASLMLYAFKSGAKRVLWCDPDVFFFHSLDVIFSEIAPETFALTPHHRCRKPTADEPNFLRNFTEGLFQAGFAGAGSEALPVLEWWSEACLWRMEKNYPLGLYVDQKYLDIVPTIWPNTKILLHNGLNLAEWNIRERRRESLNGKVLINGTDPVVFIHFTDWTIQRILSEEDSCLMPFLLEYKNSLEAIQPGFKLRLPSKPISPSPKESTTNKTGAFAKRARSLLHRIYRKIDYYLSRL